MSIAKKPAFRFADMFAGVGGFHVGLAAVGGRCVLAAEKDDRAREAYLANFGDLDGWLQSDIRCLRGAVLAAAPDFDVLCGGFPCQPFSQAGRREGFADANRGNLFNELLRILEAKRPAAYLFENVDNLLKHDNGQTIAVIERELRNLGYTYAHKVLVASDYGVPQQRKRIFIVGFDKRRFPRADDFKFPVPTGLTMRMSDVLGGHCDRHVGLTLRCGGRSSGINDPHNWDRYMVDGKDVQLTPAHGLMMQGFPASHILDEVESMAMKQLGNSVAVPVVKAIGEAIVEHLAAMTKPTAKPAAKVVKFPDAKKSVPSAATLGAAVKSARLAATLSMAAAGAAAGMSKKAVADVEDGRGQLTNMLALAASLGLRLLPEGEDIGLVLAAERERQGMSQRQAVERCGVSWQTMAKIEAGQLNVNLSAVGKFVDLLGVTLTLTRAKPAMRKAA